MFLEAEEVIDSTYTNENKSRLKKFFSYLVKPLFCAFHITLSLRLKKL